MLSVFYIEHIVIIFFLKQKTAYDMRISDWSSDVCSSDHGMNLLPLSCTGGRVVLAGQATQPPPEMQLPDGEFTLGLRPEYTYVSDPRQPGAVLAQVEKVQDVGTGQ